MAVITHALRKASNTTFFKSIEGFANLQPWKPLAAPVKTTQKREYFEWLGDLPAVKEFLDKRDIESLKEHDFDIATKDWELTLGVKSRDLERSAQTIQPRIAALGEQTMRFYNDRFYTALVAGTTGLSYDGVAFFSNSHPVDESASTNDNLLAGTSVDEAGVIADWTLVRNAFLGFVMRDGKPMFGYDSDFTIFYAPALRVYMDAVFNNPQVAAGGANINYKTAKTVATSWLTGNSWYVFKTGVPIKPFILLEEQAWKAAWDLNDDFMFKVRYYGADSSFDFGYGYWQVAIKVVNA